MTTEDFSNLGKIPRRGRVNKRIVRVVDYDPISHLFKVLYPDDSVGFVGRSRVKFFKEAK